jgi:hypothetical protein
MRKIRQFIYQKLLESRLAKFIIIFLAVLMQSNKAHAFVPPENNKPTSTSVEDKRHASHYQNESFAETENESSESEPETENKSSDYELPFDK